MNRFGTMARSHWEKVAPDLLQQLDDPERYFTQIGEAASEAIEQMARDLAGPTPSEEDYMSRVRRLNTARRHAESEVIRAMVLVTPEPTHRDQEETLEA